MDYLHPEVPDDHTVDAITACAEAVVRLQDALGALGITLPSLGVDLPSCSRPLDPRPLVELGRCNLATAQALTTALREAAGVR